jgi:hypothetical protein
MARDGPPELAGEGAGVPGSSNFTLSTRHPVAWSSRAKARIAARIKMIFFL